MKNGKVKSKNVKHFYYAGGILTIQKFIFSIVCLLFVVAGSLQAAYLFSDDFESGLPQWGNAELWDLTTDSSRSPTHSLTDSPGSFYANNADNSIEFFYSIDLSSAIHPALLFFHKYSIEEEYDYGRVEVSTNGGVNWISAPLAYYTGDLLNWEEEQLDLSAYMGLSRVCVRFRLITDSSVIRDGWYIDDVLIDEAPAAPTSLTASSSTPNAVDLSWTDSTSSNVTSYKIYRGVPGEVDWRDARMVVELTSTATNYSDIAVTPKTTYAYRVMAVADNGMHGITTEAVAATTAGLDFPFMDDGESGSSIWNADVPWALSDDDSFSQSHSWSDSPYTNYENSIIADEGDDSDKS